MILSEEELKKLVTCGIFGYNLKKTMNVLEISRDKMEEFTRDFQDPDSVIASEYQRGVDQADFAIDKALFVKVQKGDLNALKLYEERKEMQKYNQNKGS